MKKDKKEQKQKGTEEPQFKGQQYTWGKDFPDDLRVALTLYAGSVEGSRVTLAPPGQYRGLLLTASAEDVLKYTTGQIITYDGKAESRNIGKKEQDAVKRLKSEMSGTRGYTLTVNQVDAGGNRAKGTKIENTATLAKYFRVLELTRGEEKTKVYSGVELVVAQTIVPGSLLERTVEANQMYLNK